MITHDLATAAHCADRIAVIYLGRVVEEGPAREVIRSPQHPYSKALLSVVSSIHRHRQPKSQILSGMAPNAASIPDGCRFHPRCPIAIEACRAIDPSLAPLPGRPTLEHRVACIVANGHQQDDTNPSLP
jgi:peptide/nickel transport system ATP-binding protein